MLVLGRRVCEGIRLKLEDGREIRVTITSVMGSNIRLGIDAPRTIVIDRVNADGTLHQYGSFDNV